MSLPIQKESLNFLNYFINLSRSNLINHPFCCIGQIGFFFLLRKKNFCATKLCVKSLPKLLHFYVFKMFLNHEIAITVENLGSWIEDEVVGFVIFSQ